LENPKEFLKTLFDVAVEAADPMRVLGSFLPERPQGRLIVIGAGKASARMAQAVEAHYGPLEGFVITRYGYEKPTQQIEIVQAAHPVPDAAGEAATGRLLDYVSDLSSKDTVIALISGGGSALLCAPVEGITLQDKMDVNQALLASGAPISEMNTVRKRLSRVKGGKLAQACYPARLVTLLISDVPGDDPALIASGPTVADTGTVAAATDILDRWGLELKPNVRAALEASQNGPAPESDVFQNATTDVIAAPSISLKTAASFAQDCEVILLRDDLEGEARDLAREQVAQAKALQKDMAPGDRPKLLLSGGECTVTRRGSGVGGPNAEYTLAAAIALEGASGIHVMACDTDGVDGAADVAGAYASPETVARAAQLGVSAQDALDNNDAHSFFEALGDQIVTGPTFTNVNDFRAILIFA
jgi:hydroxypyruvate reductase